MAEINLSKEETINVSLTSENSINANVPDINYIPGYKAAETERRKNEVERVANENERIENEDEREKYYEDFVERVESGEFKGEDGKNTVYVGETEPTDDFYNVWINPEGTPTVEAENIVMEDGETLQEKYENGELKGEKGEKGDTGTTDYNDLGNKPDLSIYLTEENDPTVPSHVKDITETDINNWNNKAEANDIPGVVNENSDSTEDTYSCDYINAIGVKGDFIRVCITNDFTLTTADMTQIPFDYIQEQLGESLSLTEDGGIKIGKGITAIRVNAQAYFYTGTTDAIKSIYLYKNSAQYSVTNSVQPISNYTHLTTPSLPLKVSEGDVIYSKLKGSVNDLFKQYSTGTLLNVEVIK